MNWRTAAADTLIALAVVAGISVVIGAIESVNHVGNISNLYIIGIAILASRRGLYPALVASVLAFLAFDWFFIPPLHAFTVDDPGEYVALGTLLVTIVIIGQLLAVARSRAQEADLRQRHTQLLYHVSHAALSSSQMQPVYALALWRLNDTLGLGGSRLYLKAGDGFRHEASSGVLEEVPDEAFWLRQAVDDGRLVAIWVQSRNNVRVGTDLAPDAAAAESRGSASEARQPTQIHVPLRIEARVEGVLVVGPKKDHRELTADDRQLLDAFANQLAVAVERENIAAQQASTLALQESERLKTALISSVSHELKTPLAAIKASVTALLDETGGTRGVHTELAEGINRETDRLTRLVSNLLDMSRLEAGALRPNLEWVSIADVISDVLDRMQPLLPDHPIAVELAAPVPPTSLDFVQISQVLTNLLDNAGRHSPSGSAISISAEVVREQLRVTVFNAGSHIPPSEPDRLFDKFYRLSVAPGGAGLGLSIARGIVEAHGGRIWAENVGQRGVAFTFTIPSPAQPAMSSRIPSSVA
ncbi:MAG TPA: ATP-binding protein [Chloroflexota bacterium]|nr:ATP-binding protein [Chloroflexota bacterium]